NNHHIMFCTLIVIQFLIILLILPIYFATFDILSKYHFIDNTFAFDLFSSFYFWMIEKICSIICSIFPKHITKIPTITFMNPYIKFVNYPQLQNYPLLQNHLQNYPSLQYYIYWLLELIKPQPSPFVETINRDIYKTWNGEALINFKWDTYGKYYYG